ncbi:AraC family transcriptional regulator, arabinose operon regulatory protein [Streptomyces zhaozhouensis]|uniref:AraC family transcriptional regulator, arabinose operon regulatory protein n=1 Tax=Streptomyces zhaozhouensis TaxID=1300267 RepID=A0A286DSY9_9ACTN|nr:AraC family transcriptional regulator, arabinose operon regulatory protein [Streptomyces zhaozhouensis]
MNAGDLPGAAAPPPGLLTVGYFDERPGYAVGRPRGADSWLFTWTVAGAGRLRQGPDETAAGPGDLVALGPRAPHGYAVDEGAERWAFWWVHCQARPAWAGWLRPHRSAGGGLYAVRGVPEFARGRIAAAFARMAADARWSGEAPGPAPRPAEAPGPVAVAHGSAARELALGALEEVVVLAGSTARAPGAGPVAGDGVDPRVRRVAALIAADPGAPHTVASLAARVALSPSRLAHLFAEQLGQPPMRALREARLRHAARLLEVTDLSVARVAASAGFASAFHFSRVFRERYGAPPGAYRVDRAGGGSPGDRDGPGV